MSLCAFCKVEDTALYANGVPICLKCLDLREANSKKVPIASVHTVLVQDLTEASLRVELANTEFNAITSDIPSFIPQPDGTQRIHKASMALKAAREGMIMAHNRLNAFLERGIVPEDLKRSS
jgi:hypothetical protein